MSRDVDGADAEHSHQLIGRQGAVSTPGEPRNARGLGGASYKPERDSTTNRSATGQVSEKKSVFDLMQNVFHVDMESERPRGQDKGDEPAQSRRWNAKGLLRKQPASCFFDMFNERVPCRKLKCTHSLRETLIHERHVPVDVGKLHAAPEPAIHITPVPNSLLQVAGVQVAVAQAVAQAATLDRCYCCFLTGSYFEHPMLMAREGAPLRPQGDVSCAKTPSRPVPRRIEQKKKTPGLAPVACALRWSSPRLPPCENDTVLNDPLPALALAHPRQLSVYPNCSNSVLRNGARRTCRNSGTNGSTGTASCSCNTSALISTLPPSSSSAFGVNSLPNVSCSKLPAHRSPGCNRLIVRAFTTPLAVSISTVFDPSVPSTFLVQTVNPEGPDDGWMAAKASTTLAHRTVPEREQRAFPRFVRMLSCRLDTPQTDGACWLHAAQATSTDHGLLALRHPKLTPLPV